MKFGLKRASKAGAYTKTDEGRRAVLGILEIFGIKNTVLAEANTKCRKLITNTEKREIKVDKLRNQVQTNEIQIDSNNLETESINELVKEWVL